MAFLSDIEMKGKTSHAKYLGGENKRKNIRERGNKQQRPGREKGLLHRGNSKMANIARGEKEWDEDREKHTPICPWRLWEVLCISFWMWRETLNFNKIPLAAREAVGGRENGSRHRPVRRLYRSPGGSGGGCCLLFGSQQHADSVLSPGTEAITKGVNEHTEQMDSGLSPGALQCLAV